MKKSHGLQGLPDDTEQAEAQPGKASVQSVILAPHRQDHGLEGLLDDTEQAAAQQAPASVQSPDPRQSVMPAAGGQDLGLQGFTDDTEQAEAQHGQASVQSPNPRQSVILTAGGQDHGLQRLTDDTEQAEAQRGPASEQSPNPRQSVMLAAGCQDHGLQGLTDDTEQAEAQPGKASVQSHNPRQSVMLTPPGYKQTEVGVIPEDWNVARLSDIADVRDGTHESPKYVDDGVPFVTSKNILSGRVDFSDITYISQKDAESFDKRSKVDKGDILISMIGTVGNAALVDIDLRFSIKNVGLVKLSDDSIEGSFLFHYLQSDGFKAFLNNRLDGGIQKFVSLGMLRTLSLPSPPTIDEQHAIAAALTDVDALLSGLERLIAKKRAIKQATMQQLLTGKTRLPGFDGQWRLKTFKEICWFQEGPGVRNTQFTASGIKLLNGTNIFRGVLNLDSTSRFISETEACGAYAHFLADVGDIVIASSGVTIERLHDKVAIVRESDLPVCMNTSTIRFKPVAGVLVSDYLFQFLMSDGFKKAVGGQATGSAQMNFGPSHVAKVALYLPPLPEQTAIATVLTDMDAEIAALEQRRDKTRLLKQGMMQELLTGRIRLVSICTRNCTTNLRQRCTTFAARRAIEKSATLQQHCTTNLHQRCTTFDSVIRCCNQHSETPPGVMVC